MRWLVVLAFLAGACVSTPRAHGDPRLVDAVEIDATRATNALDALRRVRPQWFAGVRQAVNVILQDQRIGSPDVLAGYNTVALKSARFLTDQETFFRYGRFRGASIVIEVRLPQ